MYDWIFDRIEKQIEEQIGTQYIVLAHQCDTAQSYSIAAGKIRGLEIASFEISEIKTMINKQESEDN